MILRDRAVLAGSLDSALAVFDDVPGVLGCIPGVRVLGQNDDGSWAALIGARYGELGVEFRGTVRGERTDPTTLRVRAEGTDGRSVGASGDIRLSFSVPVPDRTEVEMVASISFTGRFTTIAYAATRAIGPRLMRGFATCLEARTLAAAS